MTSESHYLAVGHVKDAHGIKGEIYVRLFAGEASWKDQLKVARLKSRETGAVQTFAITRIRPHKEGLVLQLKEVVDRNHSETLKGLTFEIPESFLQSAPGESIYLHEILGFEVTGEKEGLIGPIKEFATNGKQDLLVVDFAGREILIPFVKEFIEVIDYEKRAIKMNLPEGLCDLM